MDTHWHVLTESRDLQRSHGAMLSTHLTEDAARQRYVRDVEDYIFLGAMLTDCASTPRITLATLYRDRDGLRATVHRFACDADVCAPRVKVARMKARRPA